MDKKEKKAEDAEIKLIKSYIEQCKSDVKDNPNKSEAYHDLGSAYYQLAIRQQDKQSFLLACENYQKAIQLNSKRKYGVSKEWGFALFGLAKIMKNKALFNTELIKFEQATKDITLPDLFLIKGELYLILGENDKASDCFAGSCKNILEIVVFLDKDNRDKIVNSKFLSSLLNSDQFFNEITNGIDKPDELDKFREVYIRSVLIILQLHINYNFGVNHDFSYYYDELMVAYYTNKNVAQDMLFGIDGTDEVSKFRLNAINYSNDPTEGRALLDYLFGNKCPNKEALNTDYGTFAGCFTFNHDKLNQFRLYGKDAGKEGTGLSLVFHNKFFFKDPKMAIKQRDKDDDESCNDKKSALFRCIYIDPETGRIETVGQKEEYLFYCNKNEMQTDEQIKVRIEEYRKHIDDIIRNVRKQLKDLKDLVKNLDPVTVGKLLINLRYLTKHIAFKEEQECRIIKIHPLSDKDIIKTSPDYKQMYIEYLEIPEYVKKVYFGPKATGVELFKDIAKHKGLNIECEQSKNPLA